MKSFLVLCSALLLALPVAAAENYTEVRELIVPASGALDANTGGVGAIVVQGWDKDYVQVRASITTNDRADLALVQIGIAEGRVWAFSTGAKSWGVEYEISVPRQFGLHLQTKVGAIEVSGVVGVITTETSVGAITLSDLAGDVTAKTGVGAIEVALTGAGWEGKGLTATTSTGAIRITAPLHYAAHFDLSTNVGGITTTFRGAHPQPTSFMGRELVFDSGGGAPIRRATTSVGRIELLVSGGR
jgi:hypothetical protein